MKKLSKLLLVNWLNFNYEVIDFDNVNFLTGKNGSGKSTIIDALQLVMLSDTQGSSFNKAANQKSDRSLESYLYGDFGTEDSVGPTRGEKGMFTSYVAAQFDDDESKRSFYAAFIADCYKDRKISRTWIIAEEPIKYGSFLNEQGIPYDIPSLKNLYREKQESNIRFDFCDTNKAYMGRLSYYLGNIGERYFSLLRKGVPFSFTFTQTPDITRFITESICEVDNHIDVEAMQNDIRQYADLEVQAGEMARKIAQLDAIATLSDEIEKEKITLKEYQYLIDRASLEEKKRDRTELQQNCEIAEKDFAVKEKSLADTRSQIEALEAAIEAIRKEIYTSDEHTKKERLEKDIASYDQEIKRIAALLERSRSEVASFLSAWNSVAQEPLFATVTDSSLPVGVFSLDKEDYGASLAKGVSAVDKIFDGLVTKQGDERALKSQLEKEIEELQKQIANLNQGVKAFPPAVVAFREALSKQGISSEVVADSAEVQDEAWRSLLEGLLDRHRFDVIVSDGDWVAANHVLVSSKGRESVTLVDYASLPSKPTIVASSLLEEIHSDNERVQRYLACLLGSLKKGLTDRVSSASAEGLFYHASKETHVGRDYAAFPFLGQNALRLSIARLQKESKEKEAELAEHIELLRFLEHTVALKRISHDQLSDYQERFALAPQLDDLREKRQAASVELASIDMLFISNLERKQKQTEAEKREKEAERSAEERTLGNLEATITNYKEVQLPSLDGEITEKEALLSRLYDEAWQERMKPRFVKEFQSCRTGSLMSSNFTPVCRRTQLDIERLKEERRKQRVSYNTHFLTPYDSSAEDNIQFDEERNRLKSIKLPEYMEKIKEAKARAYRQFREDFIAKMKANIESVEDQVQTLNKALKQAVFGSDRYRFLVAPNPKYESFYKMFKDPMLVSLDQPTLMDDSFNEKYKNEIETLFSSLMVPSTGERSDYENSVKLYTDYRTYLLFDLEVVDTITSTRQRLSRTWKKKSGGETQQPFYLALLASFSQVCRVNRQGFNNTIRLIMLDEAFSKMDGDRIKASIALLKEFKLQAIFSAPPEKIPDITPLVDRTIVVFKDKNHSFTKRYQMKQEGAHVGA